MAQEIVSIKRMHGVAHVKLENGEMFKFPSVFLSERPLKMGRMVDQEEYLAFVQQRALPFALERAIRLQAMREHSEKEIASALRRSAYPEPVIAQVLSMLTGSEIISDERFAASWVRHRAKNRGRRSIAAEMQIKGVSSEETQKALNEWPEEEELAAACKLADKLVRQGKDEQHVLQALLRRGYSYTLARKAVKSRLEED